LSQPDLSQLLSSEDLLRSLEQDPSALSPEQWEQVRVATLPLLAKTEGAQGCLAYGEYVYEQPPAPHHIELVESIYHALEHKRDTLLLYPAGAAKTTWGNRNFLAHYIATHLNVRVGLFSETAGFSERFSASIMSTYEGNARHHELFGNLVDAKKWTNSEWIVRGSNVIETKDLTVFAGGTGGQVASKRFDIFLLDDILGKDNTATVDQREKTKWWYDQALRPRGAPGAVVIGLGTRWAGSDQYERFMTPVEEDGYGFEFLVRQALIRDETAKCPGSQGLPCTLPNHDGWRTYWDYWPVHDLLVLRAKNPAAFDCAYMNDVAGILSGDVFQKRWFRYYGTSGGHPLADLPPLPAGQHYTIRVGVDLASSTKERADFTARATIAESPTGDFYVLRVYRDKMSVGHGDFIVAGYDEFPGIGIVLVESNQFQSTVIAEIMRDYPQVPIKGIQADSDKRTRATAVAAKYQAGKVFHHAALKDSDFEREQLSFPKGHDDMIDAEGYGMGLGGSSFFFGKFSMNRRPTPAELGIVIPH
jgi:predicted phage terminase large subunit-like protein